MKNNSKENHQEFISLVVDLAKQSVGQGGGPFGAAIVRDGEVIASAANRVTIDNDPTAHAEIIAIREAAKKLGQHTLDECTIYASTEPCPMCLGAIYWAGLKKVVFASKNTDAEKAGFIDAHIYREIERKVDERKLTTIQISTPDAGEEFIAWNKKEDKNLY